MTDDGLSDAARAAMDIDPHALGTYQDADIVKTSIKLRKAGDGLSQSLSISPELLPIGSHGMALVKFQVAGHTHKRIKDSTQFELIQDLEAVTVTIVDDQASERKIERQRRKNEEAAMRRKNVRPLKDADEDFDPDADINNGDDEDEDEDGAE